MPSTAFAKTKTDRDSAIQNILTTFFIRVSVSKAIEAACKENIRIDLAKMYRFCFHQSLDPPAAAHRNQPALSA